MLDKRGSQSTNPFAGDSAAGHSFHVAGNVTQMMRDNDRSAVKRQIPDIQDSIAKVQYETQGAHNLAFGLGRALRYVGVMVADRFRYVINIVDKATTLPGAHAAPVPAKDEKEHSATGIADFSKLERIISELKTTGKINFVLDQGAYDAFFKEDEDPESLKIREYIKADAKRSAEFFVAQVKLAAKEGPQTEKLIEDCLSGIGRIELLHPIWSKGNIDENYKNLFGAYDTKGNALIIISSVGTVSQIRAIIHECWHVKETLDKAWKDGKYDIAQIDECRKNLKTLLIYAKDCFAGKKLPICEEVKILARQYEKRQDFAACSSMEPDSNGFLIEKTMGMVFKKVEGGRDLCSFQPYGKKNPDSGLIEPANELEKELMNMVLNLNALPSKAGIKKSYPDAKVRNVEYHAHIVDKVPERVLEHTCPTGFANAYRAERTKAAGTHVEL